MIPLYTLEPHYKEGYNKTLLLQGKFAGPSSLYFFGVFLTLISQETW